MKSRKTSLILSSQPSNTPWGQIFIKLHFNIYVCTDNSTGHSLNLESIVDRKFGKYHVNLLMHENGDETSINDLAQDWVNCIVKRRLLKSISLIVSKWRNKF